MSASSFRFGYSVGTTVREIFRAARTTGRPILATTENIVRAFPTQSSASSAAELEEMCQVPAIVRRGINLTNCSTKTCTSAGQNLNLQRKNVNRVKLRSLNRSSRQAHQSTHLRLVRSIN
jgi:hypothetical protein